jgi:bacterioferritin
MAKISREKRRKKVIEVLNKARSMELHAIHQYMNQHYGLDDMDYGDWAKNLKLIALDEMRHAEGFAERVKELGGEPTTEKAQDVSKGQEIEAIFPFDSELEDNTIDVYNEFLRICNENGDNVSAKVFQNTIKEEQEHYNYFDNIREHIEKLGDTYLAKIAGTPSTTGLAPQGYAISESEA